MGMASSILKPQPCNFDFFLVHGRYLVWITVEAFSLFFLFHLGRAAKIAQNSNAFGGKTDNVEPLFSIMSQLYTEPKFSLTAPFSKTSSLSFHFVLFPFSCLLIIVTHMTDTPRITLCYWTWKLKESLTHCKYLLSNQGTDFTCVLFKAAAAQAQPS